LAVELTKPEANADRDQFVARTRGDFQFKTPHKLLDKCDVWVVEDVSLKKKSKRAPVKTDLEEGNLVDLPNGQAAKSGLNKSILDVAHGQFTTVINMLLVNYSNFRSNPPPRW